MNLRGHGDNSFPGRPLDFVSKARAKPDGAQNPQLVFLETGARITDRAD